MKSVVILVTILCAFHASFSQQSKPIITLDKLKDSIESIIKRNHVAGVMVGITTDDSVVFSGGFGYADLETKRKVDSSTLFRMGSVTKMFVSLGIMKLVEEQKLKLEDELKVIAPDVPFENNWESTDPVRIVHLLEHTSGFDDIKLNRLYSLSTHENEGLEMMLVHKNSMVARWKPGERTAYSNPNYAILGYIIQKISGKPYDQYLKDIILDPLGMASSNFNLRSKFPNTDVREYAFQDGKIARVPSVTMQSGAPGALWSNAHDMIKFLQLFLRDGEPLVTKQTIDEIETPHSSLGARLGLKSVYALGNRVAFLHGKYPFRGHDGLTGTCYSSCFYNRELRVGFVISSNSNRSNEQLDQLVLSFIEQNLSNKKLTTQLLDKKSIEPFLGTYQFESPRNEIAGFSDRILNVQQLVIEKDVLYIKPFEGWPSKLVQTSPLTFTYEGMNSPLIAFTKNEDGESIMNVAGTYYKQVSTFGNISKRVVLIIAILFAISTFIFGILSLVGALIRKVTWRDLLARLMPMVSLAMLVWGIQYLLGMKQNSYKMYELTSVNTHTLGIFFSTTAFGVVSILFLIYAVGRFRKLANRWFAWYLLLTSMSFCLLAFILLQAGWIGLRTWDM